MEVHDRAMVGTPLPAVMKQPQNNINTQLYIKGDTCAKQVSNPLNRISKELILDKYIILKYKDGKGIKKY